jgi:flagellar biosynthesis GTPase FlhF
MASVLATETAIANAMARQLERTDAPVALPAEVKQAIASAEKTLSAALSTEQRQAAESICGSGRGAELIVGPAGAGKTTLLGVVASAY